MECGSEASAPLKLTLQHSKGSGRGRTAVRPYTPSPARGEGGLWSAEAELPPMLKLRFSTPNRSARGSPLPRRGKGAGGEGNKNVKSPQNSPKFPQN